MKKIKKISIITLAIIHCQLCIVNAQTLTPKVTSTSGGFATGTGVSLSWTMGETHTVTLQNVTTIVTQGEEQPEIDILTGTINNSSYCAGTSVSVPFTADGYYGGANIFTAQLSDASGSFASPVNIGTLASIVSGTINAIIPSNTVYGAGYRIRVISNLPSYIGKDNGSNITVNIIPSQPGPIAGNTNPCSGSTQTYSITPVTGATSYIWTTPAGWTGTSSTSSLTVVIGSLNGSVTVKAVSPCGNSPVRIVTVIDQHYPAEPGPITGNSLVCPGSTQTYSIAPVTGATSYTWILPNGWTGTSTTTSITVTIGTSNGNIFVRANNDCGSGSQRALSVLVTNPPNTPGQISGSTSVCSGNTYTYSITPVTGATSYYWTLPAGWSGTSTSTSITTIASGNSGNISVLSINNCGPSTSARTLAVNVSVTPAQPGTITGNTTVCQASLQTYHIAAVAGATGYTWTLPSGWSGTSTTISISTTVGSAGGTISVVAHNNCGTSTASTLAITVNSIPAQPGSISGNTTVCKGTLQTYSIAPVAGAASYVWTQPAGWVGTSTTNSLTSTIGISSGNVTVKAVNSCGSSPVQTLAVTVNTINAVTISGNPANYNFCSQVSPTDVIMTASTGFTSYAWSPSGGTAQTATVSSANTYTVTATNAAGCTTTASKVVTNNCALPASLNTTNILGTSAKATWIQSQCAVNYTLQISSDQINWTTSTVTGNNHTFTGLSLSTTYYWRIQTNCNTSGTINSGYTTTQSFTTLSSRLAEEGNLSVPFNVYPNPANAMVTIAFSTMEEGAYNIRLIDMTGRVLKSEIDNAGSGDNTYILNLDGIAKGVYTVLLQKGDNVSKAKLVVE